MQIKFYKYQGTGNDFIILDNREGNYNDLSDQNIQALCNRRFGIGADGLMLYQSKPGYDFEMKYFNADGKKSSMCGNGARCLVKFAFDKGANKSVYKFIAADGEHQAEIADNGTIRLKMKDVELIKNYNGDFILDTGSPQYVKMVKDVTHFNVFDKGKDIRNSDTFEEEGINVNFVEQKNEDEIIVRTYERGVEDETFSCGTGVTASALVCYHNEIGYNDVTVHTKGGKLTIEFDRTNEDTYRNIWLCGPAEKAFEGTIVLPA